MARETVEIERKFDVEETFALPDLTGAPGVASVAEPVEHELEAAYHDTADLRLARAKVTLRRRTGGTDSGWHVKLPAVAGARRELQSSLGRAIRTPPKAVLEPVLGIVRRAPVAQVAVLRTRRLVTTLLAEDGRVLAEVADDHVNGTALPADPGDAAVVTSWREVEVELVDGDEELLAAVSAALVAAGAKPSASASKLTRVLADRLVAVAGGAAQPAGGPGDPSEAPSEEQPEDQATKATKAKTGKAGKAGKKGKKSGKRAQPAAASVPAGDVVRAALAGQLAALQDADLMVRTEQPDGVHQVRVACRRLRSILAAFRPVLDREQTDPVRDELQWVGAQLSGSRDAEVAVAHLRAVVAAEPPELVLGPVSARLQQAELQDELAGGDEARRALSTPRYLGVLDSLAELVAAPPLAGRAGEPAGPVVQDVLAHTVKRLRRAVQAAQDTDAVEALHEVRKAAKRLRYTAEVAVPVLGTPVKELISALKDVQDVLGDRQDTFVTRELCTQLGLQAHEAGENAWTYGRMHALEVARGREAEREFWVRWPQLRPMLKAATGGGA